MKRLMLLVMIVLLSGLVAGVETPESNDCASSPELAEQHKKTREEIENKLEQQQKDFLDEFTKRADYYEDSIKGMARASIVKMGLMLLGSLLLVHGFLYLIKTRMEKRKYDVWKEALEKDIVEDIKRDYLVLPKEAMEKLNTIAKNMGHSETSDFISKIKGNVEQRKNEKSSQANNTKEQQSTESGQQDKNEKKKGFGLFGRKKKKDTKDEQRGV